MAKREENKPVAFLRMAAIQLRTIAETEPSVARELLDIAQKLEAQATDIEARAR